jgi:hypothetical protein
MKTSKGFTLYPIVSLFVLLNPWCRCKEVLVGEITHDR